MSDHARSKGAKLIVWYEPEHVWPGSKLYEHQDWLLSAPNDPRVRAEINQGLPMHLAVTSLLNRTWLRSNCLALFDRMSMAHSVEARLPLLDVELVNLVVGMRNAGLEDWKKPHKWLLIEALRDALPADTVARKKQGFTPPIGDWMRGIIGRYGPLLADGALVRQGLVDHARVREGASGFDRPFLYKLVLLECWTRMHVEGESPEALGAGAA